MLLPIYILKNKYIIIEYKVNNYFCSIQQIWTKIFAEMFLRCWDRDLHLSMGGIGMERTIFILTFPWKVARQKRIYQRHSHLIQPFVYQIISYSILILRPHWYPKCWQKVVHCSAKGNALPFVKHCFMMQEVMICCAKGIGLGRKQENKAWNSVTFLFSKCGGAKQSNVRCQEFSHF